MIIKFLVANYVFVSFTSNSILNKIYNLGKWDLD